MSKYDETQSNCQRNDKIVSMRINNEGFRLHDLCSYVSIHQKYKNVIITINDIDESTVRKKIETEINFMKKKWHKLDMNIVYYSDIDSLARIYFDRLIINDVIQIKNNGEFILKNNPEHTIGKRMESTIALYPIFYEMIIGYKYNISMSYGVYGSIMTDSEVNTIDCIVDILNLKHITYMNMSDEMVSDSIYSTVNTDNADNTNIDNTDNNVRKILFFTSCLLLKPIIHMILSVFNTEEYWKYIDVNNINNKTCSTKYICSELLNIIESTPININKHMGDDDFARVIMDPIPIILNNSANFSDTNNKPDCYPKKISGMVYVPNNIKNILPKINNTNNTNNTINLKLRYIGIINVKIENGVYYGEFTNVKSKKCKHKCNWLPANCRIISINGIEYAIHDDMLNTNTLNIYSDGISQYVI